MSGKKHFPLLILILIVTSLFSGATVNFSGNWNLDSEKSDLSGTRIWLQEINVTQKGDSLITKRTYENENGEQYPFVEKLTLDGQEHSMTVYEMPRTSTAKWTADHKRILINSQITYWGNSGEVTVKTTENWNLQEKGSVLSIEFTSASDRGEQKGVLIFKKITGQ